MPQPDVLAVSEDVRESFQPVLQALPEVRDALAGQQDVVTVRPGYQYPAGGDSVPSVVVAVVPDTTPVSAGELEGRFGVPVSVTDATVEEQLAQMDTAPVAFGTPGGATVSPLEAMLRDEAVIAFAPPKRGTYEPQDPPNLPLVEEEMGLTICVSPEAGWSELETFLGATRKRLTVAMYQFTAPLHRAARLQGRRRRGHARTPHLRTRAPPLCRTTDRGRQGARSEDQDRSAQAARQRNDGPLRSHVGDFQDNKATRRAVGVVVSHQGRGPRRQCGLVVERQLAVVEPAERASVR
jgi:hypothetical protein